MVAIGTPAKASSKEGIVECKKGTLWRNLSGEVVGRQSDRLLQRAEASEGKLKDLALGRRTKTRC